MMDGYEMPDGAPGKYVSLRTRGREEAKSYRPDQLPPEHALSEETISELSLAMHALGRLDGVASEVPNPSALFSSFVYKEAEQSSRVEGTRVTMMEIRQYEMESGKNDLKATEEDLEDIQEAKNYIWALEIANEVLDYSESGWEQFDLDLLKTLHKTLMAEGRTDKDDPKPGEFRHENGDYVSISEKDKYGRKKTRFVPPWPDAAGADIEYLIDYIQSDREYPLLIEIALIHYQFETIHPFRDGNGRVGRLLIILLMLTGDLLTHPLLYLSSYFEQNRERYTNLLLDVSEKGAWEDWILFFVQGVRQQAEEALVRAKLLLRLQDKYSEIYSDEPKSVRLLSKEIISQPYFEARDAEEMLDMSYQTANEAIKRLLDEGIVEQINDQKRNRIFEAKDVVEILEYDYDELPNPRDAIHNEDIDLPTGVIS